MSISTTTSTLKTRNNLMIHHGKPITKAERRAREFAKPLCSISSCNQRVAAGCDVCGDHLKERLALEDEVTAEASIKALIEDVDDWAVKKALEAIFDHFKHLKE